MSAMEERSLPESLRRIRGFTADRLKSQWELPDLVLLAVPVLALERVPF